MRHLRFVIVGHVDHGKSTLIGRLLYDTESLPKDKLDEIRSACKEMGEEVEFAYVVDHLEEERRGHLTIDTAQVFFRTPRRDYVIIDAPGHREFLKNMITGAAQAEAAVLIVDAAEGIREQTQRHAFIVGLLGLKQLIVAVNKLDLVNFSEEKFTRLKTDLNAFLGQINLSPSHVIPIAAKQGDNISKRSARMGWYRGPTLLEALDSFRNLPSSAEKPMRFPVQDVYELDGEKVVVGRLESGRIHVGDQVVFLPSGGKSVVQSLRVFLAEGKKDAEAGESIGLVFRPPVAARRGEVVCPAGKLPSVTSRVKASVFSMSRVPLRVGEEIIFRCATQEVPARVERIGERIDSSTLEVLERNASRLEETEVGEALIATAKPVVAESFYETKELGRFVLSRGGDAVAGGIVIQEA